MKCSSTLTARGGWELSVSFFTIPLLALRSGPVPCFLPLNLRLLDLSTQALALLVAVAVGVQLLLVPRDAPDDLRKPTLKLAQLGGLRWNATQERVRGFGVAVFILETAYALLPFVDLQSQPKDVIGQFRLLRPRSALNLVLPRLRLRTRV